MSKNNKNFNLDSVGVPPLVLMKHVENAVPFLFTQEIEPQTTNEQYLLKLKDYKKNLKIIKNCNLSEYFYLCMAAHWATAGSFVPTNVDNQIREGLWRHELASKFIEQMAEITMKSFHWNYKEVTNRKAYNQNQDEVMSTHEGTWLSVAIGAYNALVKQKKLVLAEQMQELILFEIRKEESIITYLRDQRDSINFMRAAPLIAHNFGDLDRVMLQWQMDEEDSFFKKIFKLAHKLNKDFSPLLVFAGEFNKKFLSLENHRHMSLRQTKALRKSKNFLVPVGPFMDEWGKTLGSSEVLSLAEKAEIITCLFEGFKRQDKAFGYIRAFKGLIESLPEGEKALWEGPYLAGSFVQELKNSSFYKLAKISQQDFESAFNKMLETFCCPSSGLKF